MNGLSPHELALREAVIAAARGMNAYANNRGQSGNTSARLDEAGFCGFLVTPSGMPYESLTVDDIVAVDREGHVRRRERRVPSSEWRFHQAIYAARPEVHGIVHTHSIFSTTLACMGRDIPGFHYMIARVGGSVRCAPYARFGSAELAAQAVRALEERRACLLAQHGMIALGEDVSQALEFAIQVEALAEMYWRVLQIGTPTLLPEAEISAVIDNFSRYGQGPSEQ